MSGSNGVHYISTELQHISSFAELAFMASGVKKAAKKREGFALVRDRRLQGTKFHHPKEVAAGR